MGVEDEITYFKELVNSSRRANLLTINMKVDIILSAAMLLPSAFRNISIFVLWAVKLFAS